MTSKFEEFLSLESVPIRYRTSTVQVPNVNTFYERQPRILLTIVKQLELLLTRQRDEAMFEDARLEYLAFDEAHTFSGANGAEAVCLTRRLRAFCGKLSADTVCIGTSAAIADTERGVEAEISRRGSSVSTASPSHWWISWSRKSKVTRHISIVHGRRIGAPTTVSERRMRVGDGFAVRVEDVVRVWSQGRGRSVIPTVGLVQRVMNVRPLCSAIGLG